MPQLPGRRKSNDSLWTRIKNQGVENSVHYQDVYENQQIERGEIGQQRNGTGFKIFAGVLGVLSFVLLWFIFSLLGVILSALSSGHIPHGDALTDSFSSFGFIKFFGALILAGGIWAGTQAALMRSVKIQNKENSVTDLLQAKNDAYIQSPEQVEESYNLFPDVGAHSNVSPTSLIGHRMLTNKGLSKITVAQRAKETTYDNEGDVIFYEGQELTDESGNIVTTEVEMIDEAFGMNLFKTSGVPDSKELRKFQDPSKIDYNKGGRDRDKLDFETAADLINQEWEIPLYEPQRPAGVYVVDTAPVNTMVLAITRAGKGNVAPVLV